LTSLASGVLAGAEGDPVTAEMFIGGILLVIRHSLRESERFMNPHRPSGPMVNGQVQISLQTMLSGL
jgi:hypothetical protein